jgi:hypothetical protein
VAYRSAGQDTLRDRQTFVLIRVQQGVWRSAQHLSQLPAKVIRILNAGVHALSTSSRMDMRGVTCEKHSASATAIDHADIWSPDRKPARVAETNARHSRAFVEEALNGLKRWRGQRTLLIRRNRRDKEPGVTVAHPIQYQSFAGQVSPLMRIPGVQPAGADISQDKTLLIPGLALDT